ncbi:hypothetical protein AVEN_54333-1 [Araneus ventricosus]|uniref:Uncharacterized protein n=1 Tax=Araneus ventricosus TaxID=182803 RepID=A0A4Y2GDV1_ARAVE|nr:hypothetical protein AVEN_54333-1 [Araneus ventricosus]
MWAPRNVDEWLRFHMKALARLGLHEWGRAVPPPVIVRTSYGRGRAVRLCWPLGLYLSTRLYFNDCHSDFPCALAGRGAVFMVMVTVLISLAMSEPPLPSEEANRLRAALFAVKGNF